MTPLLWIVYAISKICELIWGKKGTGHEYFLTQEELKKIIEEKDEQEAINPETEEFNLVTSNIFNLGSKRAKDVMDPIKKEWLLPGSINVGQFHRQYKLRLFDYCLLYQKTTQNIVGLAFPRELIRIPMEKKLENTPNLHGLSLKTPKLRISLNSFVKTIRSSNYCG